MNIHSKSSILSSEGYPHIHTGGHHADTHSCFSCSSWRWSFLELLDGRKVAMSRVCTICTHTHRAQIEAAIASGESYRDIALQFSVGHMSVARHADGHIEQAVKESQQAREEAQALDVVKQLKAINAVTLAILNSARTNKKTHGLALSAVDRVQKQLELQARLLGDVTAELPRGINWGMFTQDELDIIYPIFLRAEERLRGRDENITAIRRSG